MLAIERKANDEVVTCLLPAGQRVWVGIACSVLRLEPRVHAQSGLKIHQPTAEFHGHRGPINCMVQVDRTIWTGSNDGSIRRWDTETGQCLGVVLEKVLHILLSQRLWNHCIVFLFFACVGEDILPSARRKASLQRRRGWSDTLVGCAYRQAR